MNETNIDRITPTSRPDADPVGFQRWRDLLFLHWEVDLDRLQTLIPSGMTVDCHEGKAYVGVVPFAMQEVRPWRWVPSWAAFNFLECNVRTYVVCDGRPGVYFFSLDAASRLAVWAARTFWSLPYFNATMQMTRRNEEIEYNVVRAATHYKHSSRYRIDSTLGASMPGTIEHFLLERYLLFVLRHGQLFVGQVHHTPYPVRNVDLMECVDDLARAAGLTELTDAPTLCHYSYGVDVEIFGLRPIGS